MQYALKIALRSSLRTCLAVLVVALSAVILPVTPQAATSNEAVVGAPRPDYPVPPASDKHLFYLQRSTNANTVVYDANFSRSGRLDRFRPVTVYWLRYATNGEKRALNFFERNLAYGVESEAADDSKGGYLVNLVSLKTRSFRVLRDKAGKVQATMKIGGRLARLCSIYVNVTAGGLFPDVHYIDIYGTDLETGKPVYERYKP